MSGVAEAVKIYVVNILIEVPSGTLPSTSHYLKLTGTFSLHSCSNTKIQGTFNHFYFTDLFVGIRNCKM